MQDIIDPGADDSATLQNILEGLVALNDPAHCESIAKLNELIEKHKEVHAPRPPTFAPAVQTIAEGDVLRFRENFRTRCVELQLNKNVIFSSSEYRTTAVHAQQQYGLSEDTPWAMYHDYKQDYDNPGRSDSNQPSMV